MQLTQFTDYSLRVLVFLGAHPDRLSTIAEIAEAYRISDNHLRKVVSALSAAGYVETIRGKGGGMRLARVPELINIGDVVRRTEERFVLVECFDEERQDCPLLPSCALRSMLADAGRNFLSTLDRYSLQDVLRGGARERFEGVRARRIAVRAIG
jgi:Rrf2 family nitric oxide-sensitive transcriptional repressor